MAGNQYHPLINNYSPPAPHRTYEAYPERANLYQLVLSHLPTELYVLEEEYLGKTREKVQFAPAEGAMAVIPVISDIRRALQNSILTTLRDRGYKVKDRFPQVSNTTVNYVPEWKFVHIYPAFKLRIMHFGGNYWLCVDHQLIVRSRVPLATIEKRTGALRMNPSQRVLFRNGDIWSAGRLIDSDDERCNIALPRGGTIRSSKQDVVPELTRTQIAVLAPTYGINPQDIESVVKRNSFLTVANAPRARLDACNEFIQQLAQNIFPLVDGEITIQLDPIPAGLRPPHFVIEKDFEEPTVAFDHTDRSKRAKDIFLA